jgi:preprotein translocase subunit YajC
MHISLLASSSDSNAGSSLFSLVFLLLIPVAMYFLLIRPQRRRMREQQSLQSSIEVGDEVVTNSGIYGFITGIEGDVFWLEIDDDVQVRVARTAIQGRAPGPPPTPADTKEIGPSGGAGETTGDKSGD